MHLPGVAAHPPRDVSSALVALLRTRVPAPGAVDRYLAENSRSFRFAARFFPRQEAGRVARVYAFCRVTDDLVDRPLPGAPPAELLACWLELARRAHHGTPSGLPLLDQVGREMADAGIPFAYAAELVAGVGMDLRPARYASMAELRGYTHRVASVVGLWLARLAGIGDPALLDHAARLGHAMQMTNILRDVGEDWRRGRLYLALDRMAAHAVQEADLARWVAAGAAPGPGYRALLEELLADAEADYALALAALREVPPWFARPAAVAAHVYRGIHDQIRRAGYDTLTRRAATGPLEKGALAARALWALRRRSASAAVPPGVAPAED